MLVGYNMSSVMTDIVPKNSMFQADAKLFYFKIKLKV